MKSVIKIEKLDLIRLMKESLENNKIEQYPYGVHWGTLGEDNEIKFLEGAKHYEQSMNENFKLEDTLDYLKENENNYVYVNFSDVYLGGLIACMDGNSYGNDYSDEDQERGEEETGVEMLDDMTTFGYIIQFKNESYIINSGRYFHSSGKIMIPPSESIDFVENCLLFENPLVQYLNKFVCI